MGFRCNCPKPCVSPAEHICKLAQATGKHSVNCVHCYPVCVVCGAAMLHTKVNLHRCQ